MRNVPKPYVHMSERDGSQLCRSLQLAVNDVLCSFDSLSSSAPVVLWELYTSVWPIDTVQERLYCRVLYLAIGSAAGCYRLHLVSFLLLKAYLQPQDSAQDRDFRTVFRTENSGQGFLPIRTIPV